MQIEQIHNLFLETTGVITDTKKITPNCFFVALKGQRFDANIFTGEAIKLGAKYVLIDNPKFYIEGKTILVDDCLLSLQELARFHRSYLNITIIGLTGSNGKTTTKELIYSVLSKKYKTQATFGNLNNHIGVPLTLLSFKNETQIGIVEMGANHQKEIEFLCSIAMPDIGYITNFGKAHLEGFGGVEGVIKGKSELYDFLHQHNKQFIINVDDFIQEKNIVNNKCFTFSEKNNNVNVFFNNVYLNPNVVLNVRERVVESNLIGIYNADNIKAAITFGLYFDVPLQEIAKAIKEYIPSNNRSQIIEKNHLKIILDAYNANPSSTLVALENFFALKENNKVVILGDMFELGDESFKEHQAIVDFLDKKTGFQSYLIGNEYYKCKFENNKITFYIDFEDFKNNFPNLKNKEILLIKGSRAMALERVLEFL